MINQIVDQRYEILEKVGEGELFQVFRARDKAANKVVVVKLLNSAYAREASFAKELMQGVRASANLTHPHIAPFSDLKPYEDTGLLIGEFVRGINLKERIRRIAPFALSAAVEFGIAIAEALRYAHSMGVPHGDLRPQNIIVTPEGQLKVTDFGVQSAITTSPIAQQNILRRAAPYHAPELSMTHKGTPAGDIYALGAVLYEMLTGSPLYSGDSLEAIADLHAFGTIPSPRTVNPGVPRAVEGIILKCLQKNPADRYPSASELLNDLNAVRDALRFGKPLSWSPIDISQAGVAPNRLPTEETTVVDAVEPVADVAANSEAIPMPKERIKPERVSFLLKTALAAVTLVIIIAGIAIAGIWVSNWAVPKAMPVPELEGKTIDEVRKIASSMDVRLNEHPEYSEKPRNIVTRTDKKIGAEIRAKQVINVWFSRGSIYVDVPKLKGMTREEAEKKLKEAGLVLGMVKTEHDPKVAEGKILKQADKTRVLHDTPIDVVLSLGPKPVEPPPVPAPTESNPSPQPGEEYSETHEFERTIRIGRDGLGRRKVRIDYEDYLGVHTAIDEEHDEGDRVQVTFNYIGKKIKLQIYYNEKLEREFRINPQTDRGDMQ
jgi:serine/threonine-protein kinase